MVLFLSGIIGSVDFATPELQSLGLWLVAPAGPVWAHFIPRGSCSAQPRRLMRKPRAIRIRSCRRLS